MRLNLTYAALVLGVLATAGVLMVGHGSWGSASQTAITWLGQQQGFWNWTGGRIAPSSCATDATESNYCVNPYTRAMMLSVHIPGVPSGRTTTLQCSSSLNCVYGDGVGSAPLIIGAGQQLTIEWDTLNTQYVGVPSGCSIECDEYYYWHWEEFFNSTCSGNVFTTGGARSGSVTITPTSSGDVVLTCGSDLGNRSITIPIGMSSGASVSLSPASASVVPLSATTLTFAAVQGTTMGACYMSGGSFGSSPGTPVGTAGSLSTGPLAATSTVFTYSCYDNAFGWVNAHSIVYAPRVFINASPEAVFAGSTATLRWSSSGVNDLSCDVVADNNYELFSGASSYDGQVTQPLTQTTTYTLSCDSYANPESVYLVGVGSNGWEYAYQSPSYSAVRSFGVYKNDLYAGMGNYTGNGKLLKCTPAQTGDPATCESGDWVTTISFSQERLNAIKEFAGSLYIGQGNGAGDGDVLYYNGTHTSVAYNGSQEEILALEVYNNKLYFGQGNGTGDGDVLVFDGGSWTTSDNSSTAENVHALQTFNGRLYAGRGSSTGDGDVYVFNGTTWSVSFNGSQEDIRSLAVYNGKLYAGQGSGAGDGNVYVCTPATTGGIATCETGDWALSYDGPQNAILSLATDSSKLYAGTGIDAGEGDILEFDGSTWATSYNPGGCCEGIFALIEFNNKMYAGQGFSASGYGDIYLLNTSLWRVPNDWSSSNNTIEVIGGGGGGSGTKAGTSAAGTGGGGGGYSKISNLSLEEGSYVPYQVGAGGLAGPGGEDCQSEGSEDTEGQGCHATSGGDTWFYSPTTVLAKGGIRGPIPISGSTYVGGAGGAAASGVGSTKFSGGAGGTHFSTNWGGAGGGAAAGPNGNGAAGANSASGSGGAGGGGANGGVAGSPSAPAGVGGSGGASGTGGLGGGANTAGARGSGGGGGNTSVAGGAGGFGIEWEGVYGAGGGGGGGGGSTDDSRRGGNGGLYGGGGGGGGFENYYYRSGGHGAQGIIKITYTPTPFRVQDSVTIPVINTGVSIVALDSVAHETPLGTGTFRLSRTGSTAADLTVTLVNTGTTAGGGDSSASPAGLSIVIPAGAAYRDITITPTVDGVSEPLELVRYAVVSNLPQYAAVTPSAAVIEMSDAPPGVLVDPDGSGGGSEGLSVNCTATADTFKTCRVPRGNNATLSWDTLYMTSCEVRNLNTNAVIDSTMTHAGLDIGPIMQQTSYRITCTDTREKVHVAEATVGIIPVIVEPNL